MTLNFYTHAGFTYFRLILTEITIRLRYKKKISLDHNLQKEVKDIISCFKLSIFLKSRLDFSSSDIYGHMLPMHCADNSLII